MIQPGRETNIPTSSGNVAHGNRMGAPLLKLDGFTITLGMVVVAILLLLIYYRWFAKKGRK